LDKKHHKKLGKQSSDTQIYASPGQISVELEKRGWHDNIMLNLPCPMIVTGGFPLLTLNSRGASFMAGCGGSWPCPGFGIIGMKPGTRAAWIIPKKKSAQCIL